MTRLQIEYMKAKEQGRSNRAQELIGTQTLEETKRSNLARESYNLSSLAETGRHNLAQEGQAERDRAERERAAKATESIRRGELAESTRSHKAQEKETSRSNLAREGETYRSNVAKEAENFRSNVARETENTRSAKAREANEIARTAIAVGEAAERVRHDMAMEAKDYATKVSVGPTTLQGGSTHTTNNTYVPSNKAPSSRGSGFTSNSSNNGFGGTSSSSKSDKNHRDWELNLGLLGSVKSEQASGSSGSQRKFTIKNGFGQTIYSKDYGNSGSKSKRSH